MPLSALNLSMDFDGIQFRLGLNAILIHDNGARPSFKRNERYSSVEIQPELDPAGSLSDIQWS